MTEYTLKINNLATFSINMLKLLSKCNNEMFSKLRIEEVYDAILNVFFWAENSTKICLLFLFDPETYKQKLVRIKGIDQSEIPSIIVNESQEILNNVLTTGLKKILLKNGENNKVFLEQIFLRKNIKTIVYLPLKVNDNVIGVVNIYLTKHKIFSPIEEAILDFLIKQGAIAIQHSLLSQNLLNIAETKTKQFITLREISEALSHQKSMHEILEIIAKESLNIVGHGNKVAFVKLLDREKKILETKAGYGDLLKKEHLHFHIPLSQRSITTWVTKNAKPRISPDVTKDPEYLEIIPETKSESCIPLLFRNEVIGVIDINSTDLNAFSDQDVELLQTLADHASVATKIGELYDVRLKQLEALYTTGTKITSSLNLNEVLNLIAEEAIKALGNHRRSLFVQLLNEENNTLEIKVARGVYNSKLHVGDKIAIEKGISGWVLKNKNYYLCSDVQRDPYYLEIYPEVKSELCVPIIFKDKVIGLINAESFDENDFGESEIQLLQSLANQAGVAIENARLNEGLANTQFQLTQALEVSVIGETLAGLSHDIRTCSSLISGEAQWIQHRFSNNKLSINEAIESMRKIENYVERIERLTQDLSRRSQQSPVEYIMTNIADVIKESIYLMHNQVRKHNVQVDVDYSSLQIWAKVDVSRIKRVFINIIMNAIDAMNKGGILSIKANKKEEDIEIKFADTGEGISNENMKKIWNNFFTTKKAGSGLGLSICKRIIEADHDGKIRIESEENRGTVVTINLPIKQKIVHQKKEG